MIESIGINLGSLSWLIMNIDTAIQLGTLILAALSIVASAFVAIRKWRLRRRGVKIDILECRRDYAYIYSVSYSKQTMCVKSSAFALQIQIANNTDQPFLVCDIRAHEDYKPTRPILVPPHQSAQFSYDGIIFESPIPLPLTVSPGAGVSFWIVVDVMIPSELGKLLFELYGKKALADETVKEFPYLLKKVSSLNDYMTKGQEHSKLRNALGVKVIRADVNEVASHLILKSITNDKKTFEARFGMLPSSAVVEVLSRINTGKSYISLRKFKSDKFNIEFVVGTGELRRISIDTKSSALWFL